MRVFRGRVWVLEGWVPIHRLSVLAYLWRGAGRFRRLVGTRSWDVVLIRHDPRVPPLSSAGLPSVEETIAEADRLAAELRDEVLGDGSPGFPVLSLYPPEGV